MHSFQPSRGRILFEVFCALAVVASMVGAWRQTDASALLTAAAAAALYAMVRLFDLARRDPAQAEEPQRIEFEPEAQEDVPANIAAVLPLTALEPSPVIEATAEEPEVADAAPRASGGRRKGGSRKGGGRRASAPKEAKVVELALPEEIPEQESAEVAPVEHATFAEPASVENASPVEADAPEQPDFADFADENHGRIAPLFEPEPFARMPRRAFGRRGRL